MSDALTGVVRLVHLFSSVAWVGGVFLWSMVVAPRIMQRGPPAIRRPFAEAVIPAITRFFKIAGVLAILSGLVLVGMIWGWADYAGAFESGSYGLWLGVGAVAAIAMAVVGFGIVAPTGKKLLATMATITGPPTEAQQAQVGALGKRIGIMSMVTVLLGSLALLGMVLAVNVVR